MFSKDKITKKISISNFQTSGFIGLILKIAGPLIDLILGLDKINALYNRSVRPGDSKEEFVTELLDNVSVKYHFPENNLERIPESGPLIIVANHPYGGLEGVILAKELSSIRSDVKIMANVGLKLIPEIRDFFIFTNPLITHNPRNIQSIKECREHLEKGGLLLFFPAGKVAYYRRELGRVTDGEWNRIAAHMALDLKIPVLPLFISGHNSSLFLKLGRIYYRFKLLMLPREFLKKKKNTVEIRCAYPIDHSILQKKGNSTEVTAFLRMFTYALDPNAGDYKKRETPPIMAIHKEMDTVKPVDSRILSEEISRLPQHQHLVDYQNFSVYCGLEYQMKNIIREITILREITFREVDEGTGHPVDRDEFDSSYTHLFIWDHEELQIVGAYRMGLTDKIPRRYLSRMFNFDRTFIDETTPALEMGRSFIVRKYQNSFYGLFLLWRGIGEFCVRHPRYRTLYGTVSMSNIYNKRSITLISQALINPSSHVHAKSIFEKSIHPEVDAYLHKNHIGLKELSLLTRSIEPDGKDIPILIKQYGKLKAEFLLIAVDDSFLNTPGLLLKVNLPEAPMSSLKMYLDKGVQPYLDYK